MSEKKKKKKKTWNFASPSHFEPQGCASQVLEEAEGLGKVLMGFVRIQDVHGLLSTQSIINHYRNKKMAWWKLKRKRDVLKSSKSTWRIKNGVFSRWSGGLGNRLGFLRTGLLTFVPLGVHLGALLLHFLNKPQQKKLGLGNGMIDDDSMLQWLDVGWILCLLLFLHYSFKVRVMDLMFVLGIKPSLGTNWDFGNSLEETIWKLDGTCMNLLLTF